MRDGLYVVDDLLSTNDERRNRGGSAKVSVCLIDPFACSHILNSPSIRVDIRFESRRSRPAIRIRDRHVGIANSVDETFKLQPVRFSGSVLVL